MIFSSDQIGKLFRSISLFCPGKTETAVRVIPKSPSGKNRNGCPVYSEFTSIGKVQPGCLDSLWI